MIAADETHNFSDDPFTSNQFVVDGRQGRKLGLVIELVSQYLKDHHPLIREAATDVFVLRGGSSSDEKSFRKNLRSRLKQSFACAVNVAAPGRTALTSLLSSRLSLATSATS
jgi:hypothetical protein